MNKTKIVFSLCFFFITFFLHAQSIAVIPAPLHVSQSKGNFWLPNVVTIYAATEAEKRTAEFLTIYLQSLGITSDITNNKNIKSQIIFQIAPFKASKTKGTEGGYQLQITKTHIKISAFSEVGLFYAVQTLKQLLPLDNAINALTTISLPLIDIQDAPRFGWRGLMLDCSRHISSISYIKQLIDMMAFYKLNTFHWHLTDDQGWRIEIKKYPKLTEIGAWRKHTLIGWQLGYNNQSEFKYDGKPYGGFYTQAEIRDIVQYAAARHITVVPEIEIPGHAMAILAAYPELACKTGKYETWGIWGVSEDLLCPTEATFTFMENVLTEICDLFPAKFIHVGGDEVPKTAWKESQFVQQLMQREGITDVEKLQGWYYQRIEKFLKAKGKRIIGWDEMLEGGVSKTAAIMSWRGEKGGTEAATHGNDVVMSPIPAGVYFDHAQGDITHEPEAFGRREGSATLQKIYHYDPIPKAIPLSKQHHILGVQANVWTEYIRTPEAANYMIFPRLFALAETAWTAQNKKNWANFYQRLPYHFAHLARFGINYRVPEPHFEINQKNKTIHIKSPVYQSIIRYTIDGKLPNEQSAIYTPPLSMPQNGSIKAAVFLPNGVKSAPIEIK
jgi:hexosaminidase